jgi:hypothetical protein
VPMPASIVCSARGTGPADEGFRQLDDQLVQFMLIKFPVGSGTFKRNKFVYVHHIGPSCGAVKRGKWNSELDKVLSKFKTTTGLTATDGKCELDIDTLVSKLQKVFVSDDGTFDLSKIKEEYNRRLREEEEKMKKDQKAEEVGAPGSPGSPLRQRKLATELGASLPIVLKAIGEDMGPFNWVTVAPPSKPDGELQLVEAGSNGLFEVMASLPADKVLFGVVRVGFGTGRFRRTKRIFFQWVGDNVGVVTRGKVNSVREAVRDKLIPCTADVTLTGAADATIPSFLSKVERIFTVDNINLPSSKEGSKTISAEEYVKALEEEQRANSAFYEEPEEYESPPASPQGPKRYDVEETINLVRQDEGGLTWGIFQIDG